MLFETSLVLFVFRILKQSVFFTYDFTAICLRCWQGWVDSGSSSWVPAVCRVLNLPIHAHDMLFHSLESSLIEQYFVLSRLHTAHWGVPASPPASGSPARSQAGERLVPRPLLHVRSAEDEEDDQPGQVDGGREQEDVSPARFCILQTGNCLQDTHGLQALVPPWSERRWHLSSGHHPSPVPGPAGTRVVPWTGRCTQYAGCPSAGAPHRVPPRPPNLKRNPTPLVGLISSSCFILLTVTTPHCTTHITNFIPVLSASFLQSRLQRAGSFVTFTEGGTDAYLQTE